MSFSVERLRATLADQDIGAVVQYEPVVGSTLDLARAAGRDGAAHGLVIIADEQTAGRGRFGRRWVAPAGVNLLFTVLVRPPVAVLERLSVVAALAVADGVQAACGVSPVFKWPNDVQVNGRKLAGILTEAEFTGERPAFALVGTGLNVNLDTAAEPDVREIAVSLRDLTGRDQSREDVLADVLSAFQRWYDAPGSDVLAAWSARLATLGQKVSVGFAGRVEHGIAESVTETGALRLRRADGTLLTLPAGEVTTRVPA
jgi:BirA family biotin operon repressor/biotin-[acetyl-CoA-carboxylase] ligase